MVDGDPGKNLQAVLQEVPDVFLQCRDMRHWWDVTSGLHIVENTADGEVVIRESECKRGCETTKTEEYLLRVDRWGVQRLEFVRTTYDYPKGYLMPAFAQADHPREILRFEQMRRELGGKVTHMKGRRRTA